VGSILMPLAMLCLDSPEDFTFAATTMLDGLCEYGVKQISKRASFDGQRMSSGFL
jgi:hypothetical protein